MPSNPYPAIIRQVDRERREVRVEIPPYTDGAGELPIAEISYPIGDDSRDTEIRLVEGREVWVSFIAGDPRRPLITGFRNPNIGNVVGMRRWNHDSFEINADQVFTVNAGTKIALIVGGSSLIITASAIQQLATALGIEAKTAIKGPVTQTGGDITSDGISVQHHTHPTAPPGPASEPQ